MNVNELMTCHYIKNYDLGEQDATMQIERLEIEEVIDPRSGEAIEKGVLYFNRVKKGLILSKPNIETIARLHGPETDDWTGKLIKLYVETGVKAFGKSHDTVRVRPIVPPPAKKKTPKQAKEDTDALFGPGPSTPPPAEPAKPPKADPGQLTGTDKTRDSLIENVTTAESALFELPEQADANRKRHLRVTDLSIADIKHLTAYSEYLDGKVAESKAAAV